MTYDACMTNETKYSYEIDPNLSTLTNIYHQLAFLDDDDLSCLDFRNFLISDDDCSDELKLTTLPQLAKMLDRESLTELLLYYSLCPLHAIDYAICFDDNDAECAAIRTIHPSHDT
jgi:hypothetical protein